jgi:50S ribosomal subunit-associated GTPase HflX
MKNKLLDLNNHLFAQLERLNDENFDKEQLSLEIDRARAITGVANQLINNARLVYEAHKALSAGDIRTGKGRAQFMLGMVGDIQEDQD